MGPRGVPNLFSADLCPTATISILAAVSGYLRLRHTWWLAVRILYLYLLLSNAPIVPSLVLARGRVVQGVQFEVEVVVR